ncbi:MAG: HEAT repeat domain-containing protein [Fidelibacterota bacterium]
MTDKIQTDLEQSQKPEKKSILRVVVHSFFVVPFLIAIFAVLIYLMVRVLTVEPNTARDYLEHVKTGGTTKRWQGAFELSKILSNPKMVPTDDRFVHEMISTFEYSVHEKDSRIRVYLALAMGRTGDMRYTKTLVASLKDTDVSVIAAAAYALGLIHSQDALDALKQIANHEDAGVRLQAIIALGNYKDERTTNILINALEDPEVNVQWDAAVALAKQKNNSGRRILLDLLDRNYLDSFLNIDPNEQDQTMLIVMRVIPGIIDPEFRKILKTLSENDKNLKIREAAHRALGY